MLEERSVCPDSDNTFVIRDGHSTFSIKNGRIQKHIKSEISANSDSMGYRSENEIMAVLTEDNELKHNGEEMDFIEESTENSNFIIITSSNPNACYNSEMNNSNYSFTETDQTILENADEILVEEEFVICRLCHKATTEDDIYYIYDKSGKDNNLEEAINVFLSIKVNEHDDKNRGVCSNCFDQLNVCYEFSENDTNAQSKSLSESSENSERQDLFIQVSENSEDLQYPDATNIIQDSKVKEVQNEENSSHSAIFKVGNNFIALNDPSVKVEIAENFVDSLVVEDFNYDNRQYIAADSVHDDSESVYLDTEYLEVEYLDSDSETKRNEISSNCLLCDLGLKSMEDTLQHIVNFHPSQHGKEHICVLCNNGFLLFDDLKDHLQKNHHLAYHGESNLVGKYVRTHNCKVCQKRYSSATLLAKHTCAQPNKKVSSNSLTCGICSMKFHTKVRLNFHRQFHIDGARKLFCEICNEVFTDENQFFDHVNFLHEKEKIFDCYICDKSFHLKSALTSHMRSHTGQRNYKCNECGKTFLDKQTLNEHKVVHMKVKPYQCHICFKYLNRNSRLKKHLLTHESEPVFRHVTVCSICHEAFSSKDAAQLHDETSHYSEERVSCISVVNIDIIYRCEYCEKCFHVKESLNEHRSKHQGPTPFECNICGVQYSAYSRCTTHKTTHGIHKEGVEKEVSPVVKHFLCEHCGKSYLHWTYLQVHRKLKHSENPHMYKCQFCDMKFPSSWGVAYHRKKFHTNNDTFKIKINEHICTECDEKFSNKTALNKHLKNNHPTSRGKKVETSQMFTCTQCGKLLASRAGLLTHSMTHEPEGKKFQCPQCEKMFYHNSGLVSHVKRIHNKVANYNCSYCEKKFYNLSDMENHVRKHTGEKPFTCETCGHKFRTRSMCNEHMRIHKDIRPFKCEICSIRFRRSYALKNHKLIHTGVKNFGCNQCTRTYRLKSELKAHVKAKHLNPSYVLMVDMADDDSGGQILSTPTDNVQNMDISSDAVEFEMKMEESGVVIQTFSDSEINEEQSDFLTPKLEGIEHIDKVNSVDNISHNFIISEIMEDNETADDPMPMLSQEYSNDDDNDHLLPVVTTEEIIYDKFERIATSDKSIHVLRLPDGSLQLAELNENNEYIIDDAFPDSVSDDSHMQQSYLISEQNMLNSQDNSSEYQQVLVNDGSGNLILKHGVLLTNDNLVISQE